MRNRKSALVVLALPPRRELPVELWLVILSYLPDFKSRAGVAATCWASELACLVLLSTSTSTSTSNLLLPFGIACINAKLPPALRFSANAQPRYREAHVERAFFYRRLVMDQATFHDRGQAEDRILFHQDVVAADAKAIAVGGGGARTFSALPGRGKTMRVMTALHSAPHALCVWEDRGHFYRIEAKHGGGSGEITSLVRSPNGQVLAALVPSQNKMHIVRENEHTLQYGVQASLCLPFHPTSSCVVLGPTRAVFSSDGSTSSSSSSSRLLQVDLETSQVDDEWDVPSSSAVCSVVHAAQDRFLVSLQDGSTVVYDARASGRQRCAAVLPSPPLPSSSSSEVQVYPVPPLVQCANSRLFARTSTVSGRVGLYTNTTTTASAVWLPKMPTTVLSLCALEDYIAVGHKLGVELWDARLVRNNQPVARISAGFACHNLFVDSCKLVMASNGCDMAVSDYYGQRVRRMQTELPMLHMDVSRDESALIYSAGGGGSLAVLHTKLDRRDLLVTPASASPTVGEAAAATTTTTTSERHRLRAALQLQAERAEKHALRQDQRRYAKAVAQSRWDRAYA